MNTTTSKLTLVCYAFFGLSILLGCAQTREAGQRLNRSIKRAAPPLDDIFGNKSKSQSNNNEEEDIKAEKAAVDAAKTVKQDHLFFDVPKKWSIVKYVEASKRYQLKHESIEGASLVISYQDADTSLAPDKRQEQLRVSHKALTTRLPSAYKVQEYREWRKNDRPHILTTLKGKKADDAPFTSIEGYSVATTKYNFVVFAAYPSSNKLSPDINAVVQSLRPVPPKPEKKPDEKDPASIEDDTNKDTQGDNTTKTAPDNPTTDNDNVDDVDDTEDTVDMNNP